LLRKQARAKLPGAPLIAYVDGSHWHKERWKKPVKRAAAVVELPAATCAYTLRHSTITDLVTSGLDLLTVARIAGTSVMMIEKHYGHLQSATAKKALAALEL
jgi:site-specific recombinase XerD